MIYYVNGKAEGPGNGSEERPFRTIQEAAVKARPGDEVRVLPGVYREWVNPIYGGTPEARIVYKSVEKGGAVITGAEQVKTWEDLGEGVWRARIPNREFPDRNPFTTLVSGDWLIPFVPAHTGDVFLNGRSLYEAESLEGVYHPEPSKLAWDQSFASYTWYAGQDEAENETVLYANFHHLNPNEENVEISARKACFYPEAEGIGYLTVSGFVICQAATQWAPPTAYQEGMIGPHWSKGWIIEDCEIFESKCSGISLGKYLQPANENKWSKWKYKDGTQTERDAVCQAQYEGWTKERIGGHTVRRCDIHDCGQTGIVGHLGGVFSVIEDNHIHHINNKQNLAGAEIGGIKMHAAIDVIIRRNHIHHCTRGLWLDWQAQGTRVTGNLFHDNTLPHEHLMIPEAAMGIGEDIFVEVSHGPTLIDHNLLLSTRSLKLPTQGAAVVHNLLAGSIVSASTGTGNGAKTLSSARYTPYHVPHRTEIAGFMTILHGDMRFYNNVFLQRKVHPFLTLWAERNRDSAWDDGNATGGTWVYNGYPTREEWEREFEGYCGMGSAPSDRYYMRLPVWSAGNVYLGGALAWEKEEGALTDGTRDVLLSLEEKEGHWTLKTNLGEILKGYEAEPVTTERLGMAFEPEQRFENPDGTPIDFEKAVFGAGCAGKDQPDAGKGKTLPGPFARWEESMELL